MDKASDLFELGQKVEIICNCPLRGLEGELVFVSDDCLQVEVSIDYWTNKYSDKECSSYFRGLATDVEPLK